MIYNELSRIYACARLDPMAGEGLELGAVYQPAAVVEWQDGTGSHRKLLCDPKRRVFSHSRDALRIASAMAKRYIDTTLAGDRADCPDRRRGRHQFRRLLLDKGMAAPVSNLTESVPKGGHRDEYQLFLGAFLSRVVRLCRNRFRLV
jgi:hypothetical protein